MGCELSENCIFSYFEKVKKNPIISSWLERCFYINSKGVVHGNIRR